MSDMSGTPFQTIADAANDYTKLVFVFNQLLRGLATATIVRVEACSNNGGISPWGTVDVTPMVNQVDGAGQPEPHGTIYGLPYARLQGGTKAVILDPVKGDFGIAVFASRDISLVVAAQGQANPGSSRVMDYADGMYIGGLLNATPTSYIAFTPTGIEMVDPTKITLQAPTIDLVGNVAQTGGNATMSGSLAVTGDVTAEGTSVHNHVHGGVQPGSGSTAPPT